MVAGLRHSYNLYSQIYKGFLPFGWPLIRFGKMWGQHVLGRILVQKIFGVVVLVIGLILLGIWAQIDHATRMETEIDIAAQSISQSATLEVEVTVSGRDITVQGTAASTQEHEALLTAFDTIKGRRILNADDLLVLKTVSPFVFRGAKTAENVSFSGNAPSRSVQSVLSGVIGQDANNLDLAQGVPNKDWADVVMRMSNALNMVTSGNLEMLDGEVTLKGEVPDFDILDEVQSSLAEMPNGYTTQIDLQVPDTKPFTFQAVQMSDGLDVSGLVPNFEVQNLFKDKIGDAALSLQRANGMPDEHWPIVVNLGLAQLSTLSDGFLSVKDRHLTLSGIATDPLAADAVKDALINLPQGYEINFDVEAVIVSPYEFDVIKDNDVMQFEGLAPNRTIEAEITAELGPRALGSITLANGMPDVNWSKTLIIGIQALDSLIEGELVLTDRSLLLHGLAAHPNAADKTTAHLNDLPSGYDIDLLLEHADDGLPLQLEMTYDAKNGATWQGKAPSGVGLSQVTAAMGNTPVLGSWITSGLPDDTKILERMAIIGSVLPEYQSAKAILTNDKTVFDGVVLLGGDHSSSSSNIAALLGEGAITNVTPHPEEPKEGEARLIEGVEHIYRSGVWVRVFVPDPEPDVLVIDEDVVEVETLALKSFKLDDLKEFEPNNAACIGNSNALLSSQNIVFTNGSAELTDDSQSSLDAIAMFVGKCIHEADLRLEIGGHTDSEGDDESNQTLSTARAMAVLLALVDRGIEGKALSAQGFGEANPIADNETEEGRQMNRRTTFEWSVD
jgi:OOP family OmpA-OmpF porin